MPGLRDWFLTLVALAGYFTVVSVIDPAESIEPQRVEQERTMDRYFTEQEQQKLLLTLKLHSGDPMAARDYAWVRMLAYSGLRINEFRLVNIGDALAALDTGYLYIPKDNRKGKKRDHSVFLTELLREAIRDMLKLRGDCGADEALLVSRHGTRMTVRNCELRFAHWAKTAGMPAGASPHWLRHTRAMNIMLHSTAKDPRGVVQRALGHADIRSSGVYTQTPREAVENALAEIDRPQRRVTRAALRRNYEGRAA